MVFFLFFSFFPLSFSFSFSLSLSLSLSLFFLPYTFLSPLPPPKKKGLMKPQALLVPKLGAKGSLLSTKLMIQEPHYNMQWKVSYFLFIFFIFCLFFYFFFHVFLFCFLFCFILFYFILFYFIFILFSHFFPLFSQPQN